MKLRPLIVRALLPHSLGARGAVLLLIVSASLSAPAYCGYRLLRRQAQQRQDFDRDTLLTAALADRLEAVASDSNNRAWLRELTERRQRIRWAGLIDHSRQVIELQRHTALAVDEVVAQVNLAEHAPGCTPLRTRAGATERLELVTIPQPGSNAVLAVLVDCTVLESGPLWVPLALIGLTCAALAGLGAAWIWFRVAIARPIGDFGARLATVQAGLTEAAGEGVLPSELDDVARSVVEMRQDLARWRGEVTYWRNSIDAAVTARTRRAELAQRRAEREAGTDVLTGLGNRRELERELPLLLDAQRQARGDLAVIVFDVDNFKRLNDSCGHQAGDALLAFLGELIRASLRKGQDLACRSGGDEFIIALRDASLVQAADTARRIARLFAQRVRTMDVPTPQPAISAGVASLREHAAATWQDLVRLADEAMYWGRGQKAGVATAVAALRAR